MLFVFFSNEDIYLNWNDRKIIFCDFYPLNWSTDKKNDFEEILRRKFSTDIVFQFVLQNMNSW